MKNLVIHGWSGYDIKPKIVEINFNNFNVLNKIVEYGDMHINSIVNRNLFINIFLLDIINKCGLVSTFNEEYVVNISNCKNVTVNVIQTTHNITIVSTIKDKINQNIIGFLPTIKFDDIYTMLFDDELNQHVEIEKKLKIGYDVYIFNKTMKIYNKNIKLFETEFNAIFELINSKYSVNKKPKS